MNNNTVKLSFGMIVLNGEPFIRYNLENLYPHAHEILIVEGAVVKFAHAATADGHSIDKTVEIIRSFPDPEGKIRLIQREGFWTEKDQMSNAYMEVCTGEYIWQVDVDEFYKSDDIEKIRELLMNDPNITRIDFKSIGFWRSFKARMMGATLIYGADEFVRLFVFKPGYRYITHRPPTLANEHGQLFDHKRIVRANELESQGVVQYHYSYVFPEYVKDKAVYYSQMGWGQGHEDGVNWYQRNWCKIRNPLRIHIVKMPPSWLEPFEGEHPEVITEMINDIGFKESSDILNYLRDDCYRYKQIGENLANIILNLREKKISRFLACLKSINELVFPACIMDIRVNLSIIVAAYLMLRCGKVNSEW